MELGRDMESGRSRTKPLIPEPFQTLLISTLSPISRTPRLAGCNFCPDLDVPHYSTRISEGKQRNIDQRARRLEKRAIQNQHYNASEFNWEADAWHDVFGLIRNDDTFRMLSPSDKRPYEFVERDANDNILVKRRIPDATMGLKSYEDSALEQGYYCEVPACKKNHDSMQPHESLSKDRIHAQMHNWECGLIVDGIWGESNLIFPFSVYEAKKSAATWEQAEEQIYHACRTYLAMLDDLARDPTDVTKYQSDESKRYQLFAFTSCGSYWKVYIAWCFLDGCHVETIWDGDVQEYSCAYDLICIVDQIHEYAAHQHREFVIEHLEPWLRHAEECSLSYAKDVLGLDPEETPETPPTPEWSKLKPASKQARMAKSAETRRHKKNKILESTLYNKTDRSAQTLQEKELSKQLDAALVRIQRGRGRPKNKFTKRQSPGRRGRLRKGEN